MFSFMHYSQGENLVWIQLFAVYGTLLITSQKHIEHVRIFVYTNFLTPSCPPSRRRSGRSPAAPYPPARRIDCPQETERKSTIEFNLHRDLYRRGVKLLTINKERT